MATIEFRANIKQPAGESNPSDPLVIEHTAPSNSGIGFFGGDFGLSVPVGASQESTFVTSADGTSQGIRLQNNKYLSASTAEFGESTKNLNVLCNYYAPLNIRFTHASPVRTQSCKLRIFDRQDITKAAHDVDTFVYEVRHPNPTEGGAALNHRGVAGHTWHEFEGSDQSNRNQAPSSDLTLTSSPGTNGLNGNETDGQQIAANDGTHDNYTTAEGNGHLSTQHDWFISLSAQPTTIGSKTNFGLYFTLEYLD